MLSAVLSYLPFAHFLRLAISAIVNTFLYLVSRIVRGISCSLYLHAVFISTGTSFYWLPQSGVLTYPLFLTYVACWSDFSPCLSWSPFFPSPYILHTLFLTHSIVLLPSMQNSISSLCVPVLQFNDVISFLLFYHFVSVHVLDCIVYTCLIYRIRAKLFLWCSLCI